MLHPEDDDAEENKTSRNKLEEDLYHCRSEPDAYAVAYVSKMFAVPRKELPENKPKAVTAEEMRAKGREAREARLAAGQDTAPSGPIPLDSLTLSDKQSPETNGPPPAEEGDEILLGFSRLYSGTITRTSKLYCTLPKYNTTFPPTHPANAKHVCVVEITALYIMMGRDLVPVEKVVAGNVFALAGLGGIIWRNGTLCGMGDAQAGDDVSIANLETARPCLVNLAGISNQAAPIVRVALEPVNPGAPGDISNSVSSSNILFCIDVKADMPQLIKGLKLLSQADPCVETFQQQTGEYVILTAGELHLEVSTCHVTF